VCHPDLDQFSNWYSSGKKVWPPDLKLTPTVLKHWYCGDGNLAVDDTHRFIQISVVNERNNRKKIEHMFDRVGFEVSNWNIGEDRCSIQFSKDESDRMFDYMGQSLPGFGYKWPK
jgi:hypothetical protein